MTTIYRSAQTRSTARFALVLLILCELLLSPFPRPQTPLLHAATSANDLLIFDETLASGWQDWSWDSTRNFENTTPVHRGSKSLAVSYTKGWGGLLLHSPTVLDATQYRAISFWANGNGTQRSLLVFTNATDTGGSSTSVAVTLPASGWSPILVTLAALGTPGQIASISIMDGTGSPQAVLYLDEITLVGKTTSDVIGLSVNVSANRKPISPYIYGMNFANDALIDELDIPVRRWGGNATTRYNYLNDNTSSALDWYFLNHPSDPPAVNPPTDSAANKFIAANKQMGTQTLLTIPLIGYVANDAPFACGFSVSKYAYAPIAPPYNGATVAPFHEDCGSGILGYKNGNQFQPIFVTSNNPLDSSIAITPAFVAGWVNYLKGPYGAANSGGVQFYNLDNEPDLWNTTHADIHPAPYTYDELRDRTFQYAAAIKAADPAAKTLGPAFGGWWAYFTSTADTASGTNNDRQAHGNLPIIDWYLRQMRSYEQSNGKRILDYLDLHIYPQNGVALSDAGDGSKQALRLRSTRSLWDPTYIDESWIKDAGPDGGVVKMIPRMRDWVANNYPGTKINLGEYNWGALDHINGALTQADILGIFGREGLDMATLWSPPEVNQPGAFAFRIFRNYDGAGARFGDINVGANSDNQEKLAIYAAQNSSDNALTLVIINKTSTAISSRTALTGFNPAASGTVYRYSAANLNAIVKESDVAVSATGFDNSYPANSITLVKINATNSAPPTATATATHTPVPPTKTPTSTPTPPGPTATPIPGGVNVKINFQPKTSVIPAGYLIDSGEVFGNRGNGFSYGWDQYNPHVRDRDAKRSPDQRFDTLFFTQRTRNFRWEIALPNGLYNVKVVAGDPNFINSVYRINLENTRVISGTPTDNTRWFTGTAAVTVDDGKLTLSSALDGVNNKVCFIEIASAPVATALLTATPSALDEDQPGSASGNALLATLDMSVQVEAETMRIDWAVDQSSGVSDYRILRSSTEQRSEASEVATVAATGAAFASYTYIDRAATGRDFYNYWLTIQDNNGASTESVAVMESREDAEGAEVSSVYLPVVLK